MTSRQSDLPIPRNAINGDRVQLLFQHGEADFGSYILAWFIEPNAGLNSQFKVAFRNMLRGNPKLTKRGGGDLNRLDISKPTRFVLPQLAHEGLSFPSMRPPLERGSRARPRGRASKFEVGGDLVDWPLCRNWGLGGTLCVLTHLVLSGLIGCARDCQQSHHKGRDDPVVHGHLGNSSVISPIPEAIPKAVAVPIPNRVLVKRSPSPASTCTQYACSAG